MNPYELITGFNHDLRNPLCTVNNLLYLLRREMTDANQIALLNSIEAAHGEIQELINSLVDFSKLQTNNLSAWSEKFSLQQLLAQLQTSIQYQTQSQKISVHFECVKDQHLELYGNKTDLFKALQHVFGIIVSISHSSHIRMICETDHNTPTPRLVFKIVFQGKIQENQAFLDYFSTTDYQTDFSKLTTTKTYLHLAVLKALLQNLNAEIMTHRFTPQSSQLAITLPMTHHVLGE